MLTIGQQAFLQVIAQRKVMSEAEAVKVLSTIGQGIAPGQSKDVKAVIEAINKKLVKSTELEIRGIWMPKSNGTSGKVYALINPVSDNIAKSHGNTITPADAATFRSILATIANSNDYHCPANVFDRGQFTKQKFTVFLDLLTEERWLDKDDNLNTYTFGPRSFLELADHLRNMDVDVPQHIFLTPISTKLLTAS